MSSIEVFALGGIPEISEGDDLAAIIVSSAKSSGLQLADTDIVVVAQKVVSKAEGRIVRATGGDRVGIVEAESARILRRRGELIISETTHGFVCANAGVDSSNVPEGFVSLLPKDPDRSARRLRKGIKRACGERPAVIISDTFGRPWRIGQTNIALGVAGMLALQDYRGSTDQFGRPLTATSIAVADEVAGAAELVMGKSSAVPVAVVRGYEFPKGRGSAQSLVRRRVDDLFR